jgi:RHS repeat-associated protein
MALCRVGVRLSAFLSASLVLLVSSCALAQQLPAPGIIPGFSTLETHEYDTINLGTLGIDLNVSVRTKAGHIPFSFILKGASQISRITTGTGEGQNFSTQFAAQLTLVGKEPLFEFSGSGYTETATSTCQGHPNYTEGGWVYTDTSGTAHPVQSIGYLSPNTACSPTSGSAYTSDGSGLYVFATTNGPGYAIDANGNKIVSSTSNNSFTDPNGNSISSILSGETTTYTDTLGELAITKTTSVGAPQETDTWTDALGNNQSVKVTNTQHTQMTAFGCGSVDQQTPVPNAMFTTNVGFPDGSSLVLGWEKNYSNNSYYTGRIASLTLPTGGVISYAYSGGTNGINCIDATPATLTRTTPDGMWTYKHVPSGNTTVTDPLGNNIVYSFVYLPIPLLTWSPDNPLETEKQVYNGSAVPANLIQTVITCYNNTSSSPTSCNLSGLSLPIFEKDVYTTYPGVTGYAAVKTAYDTYGRITDVKTFDFNAANPTNEKQIAYGSGSPTSQSCTAISTYIIGKPCSVTLLDSQHSNAILGQTWNAYDSNGNLLQTWNLVSGSGATGTYLSKQYTYTNGVVQTATDVNGQVTNYTTTSCNNMFVTSQYPTNFNNLLTSQVWDCNGGVVTSSTDANSQVTQDVFYVGTTTDPFYRPLEDVDELGYITNFTYTITPFNTVDSAFLFNGNSSVIETLSTTDSLGRPKTSQLRQGPSSANWDTKTRTFDGDGRVNQTSLTCVQTASVGCSNSTESQTYDALNRPLVHVGTGGDVVSKTYPANDVLTQLTPAPSGENLKSTQKEYDGLGRLKSVCVISSATGSSSCGQTTAATGFLTSYSYDGVGRLLQVIENAQVTSPQQARTYTYDLLGRVLTEANPESGTRSFTYDSVTSTNCTSTSQGDLVQETDANTNATCYHYDGLHRKTYITYSGPNSNNVSKYFVYDAATVNGTAMTYAEGHMAEAYTCSGSAPPPCTSKITDEGFSYDQRGQMNGYYQKSPNSNGYERISATFWEDHTLKTAYGVGLRTTTYGNLDGEGRVTTVTDNSGPQPVTGVTYNNGTYTTEPIGALLTVTLGSGDTENFTYDPNTGRMTSYSASVGATPVVISGNLTWNANGTLQQNSIVDGYNAADTQDCTYQYDDFIRAASVNCLNGSTKVWNQTFTYGTNSFGNLTKTTTGPGSSWACTACYNTANNQYNNVLSSAISYDADGNLTDDTFHSYTWLADGHVATIVTPPNGSTTASITYDALGNKVEESVGGTIYEYVSAFGVNAQMSGSTEDATTVDLVGGVQGLYSGSNLQRFRFPDWQGSIRAESNPTSRVFTESLAFAPFGERYAIAGAPYNVDSFTGKPDQLVSDEYDFLARQQHNGQGRWVSPDPMRGTGNKYVYADNNPLSKVDIYGLFTTAMIIDPAMLAWFDSEMNQPDPLVQSESHGPQSGQTGAFAVSEDAYLTRVDFAFEAAASEETPPVLQRAQAAHEKALGEPEAQNRQPDGSYKATPAQLAKIKEAADKKTTIGNGQCVTACERFTGVPGPTSLWEGGKPASELTDKDKGTAIATFVKGPDGEWRYLPDANGHMNSGTFMGTSTKGTFWMADQWPQGKPVSIWNVGSNPNNASMNAASYRVIIVPNP